MKRQLVLGALALCLVLPGGGAAQNAQKAASGPKPVIEIPKMKMDFGEVFEREKYEYDFRVFNRGDADLIIEDVKPG
jgi:hypothetical protein